MTVINLRHHRKQKQRQQKEQIAAENRHKFGLTKAEKHRQQTEQKKADNHLSAHHLTQDAENIEET